MNTIRRSVLIGITLAVTSTIGYVLFFPVTKIMSNYVYFLNKKEEPLELEIDNEKVD